MREITCQEFVEVITDWFEGAVGADVVALIEEHLVMCDWCTTYSEQMQATIAALGADRPEEEPAGNGDVVMPSEIVLAALQARRESNA